MPRKPPNLICGVEDRPPLPVLLMLGVQHIILMSSTLVLPVVLVSEIGGSPGEVRAVVGWTMIACGIGTVVQAMRWRGIGSGYLCPNLCGPNFFAVCLTAAWLGGLPLMRGMTIAAGIVEALFSRVIHKVEFLFPTEITGLVVFMVAVGLIPLGASKFLGINFEGEPILSMNLLVAAITLAVMVGSNIWGRGRLRLYGVLIGMVLGYMLSVAMGLISRTQFRDLAEVSWIAFPALEQPWTFSFRWSLLPAFVIVSICGALKTFGNLILCEKVNDAQWTRPEIKRIGDGLMADSICVTMSGLLGGMASDSSASNVSLSSVTGATSRRIAYVAGALFIALGFSPKLGVLLSVMPMPVMGAVLVFVVSFMLISGLQIILSSGVDPRKTFVIGISLTFGLSLEILPGLYARVFPWLRPLFDSSLTLTTVLAVVLNQFLRPAKP